MRIRTLKAGFTLIELLVVIAIIGLLASVVLASLNSARDKGAAASIKANLNNARVQAELYYDNNQNSYGVSSYNSTTGTGTGVCNVGTATNPTMYTMLVAANTANGGDAAATVLCNSTAAAWAAEARLVPLTPTAQYYCVDSTGIGEVNTTSKGTATACP